MFKAVVGQGGRPLPNGPGGRPEPDGGSGQPLCSTVGGVVGEAVHRSRLPTSTGRPRRPPGGWPKRRTSVTPWGATDAERPDA
jgi:hypothetical protein